MPTPAPWPAAITDWLDNPASKLVIYRFGIWVVPSGPIPITFLILPHGTLSLTAISKPRLSSNAVCRLVAIIKYFDRNSFPSVKITENPSSVCLISSASHSCHSVPAETA